MVRERRVCHNVSSPPSAYLQAFQAAGLEVLQCLEPGHGEEEVVLMAAGMMDMAGDAFRSALLGVPGALVWLLQRREH